MNKPLTLSVAAFVFALSSFAAAETCEADTDGRDRREICKPRDIFLMPGVDGVIYKPNGRAAGTYVGAGVHFAPYQWSHNNEHFGPSQGSIFLQTSLLRSQESDATMALVEAGMTLSFERNSARPWLIPYFGDTTGGVVHKELPSSAYNYPFIGVHGIYTPHVMLDVQGGYMFPFRELDVLRGPRGEAVMRVSMW